MSNEYQLWGDGIYPYDRASCGACLSEHSSPLCCSNPAHEPLRKAAEEFELVRLVGKLRKTDYAPMVEKIRKTFMRLRKKYRKLWSTPK